MTPKEKAKEIYNRYCNMKSHCDNAIECALIAVDEIIEFMKMDDEYTETASNANSKWVEYWQQVKQEIDKMA